ncbi:MAG: hypothetical protein ACQEVA_01610, partial [Myxococcota bacterium]
DSDYDTLKLVRDAEIPPLKKYGRTIPPALEKIIRKSLAKDPAERHQSAEAFGRELAQFMFEHGSVVSGFDIASLVQEIIEKQPRKERKTTEADLAAGEQIQKELNQLVSLEEMGNLDLFMTEVYGDISAEVSDEDEPASGSEDPREWMDLGFGGDEPVAPAQNTPAPTSAEDSWQEGGLGDVAHATQSMQAVEGPQAKKGAEKAREDAKKAKEKPKQPQKRPPQNKGGQQTQSTQRSASTETNDGRRQPAQKPDSSASAQQPRGADRKQNIQRANPQAPNKGASTESKEGGSNALVVMLMLIVLVAAAIGAYFFVLS